MTSDARPVDGHGDRAEPVLVAAAGKQLQQPLGPRVGGHVPVRRRPAQQLVADAAADDVCGVAAPQRSRTSRHPSAGEGMRECAIEPGVAALSCDRGRGSRARPRCADRRGTA